MPSDPAGPHRERCSLTREGRFFTFCTLLAAFLPGCDTNQFEPRDTADTPPAVAAPFVSPAGVRIDTLVPSGQIYTIVLAVGIRATDPDGQAALSAVRAEVLRPGSAESADAVNLQDNGLPPDVTAGDSMFSGTLVVHLRRDQAGIYRIRFQSQNTGSLRSTSLELPFPVTRDNTPPELDSASFTAPDTLTRPASGTSFFFMSIGASDADGLQDIREVFLQNLSSLNKDLLFDDGGAVQPNGVSSGDLVTGDGIFSVTLQLPSTVPAGSYAFRLQAVDSFNDTSRSLPYTLVVRTP